MPNINGTNGDDDIEVTNDSGTLNGTPQGSPIDNISGRGGSDTITVIGSTVTGSIRGNQGSDDIVITASTVDGLVAGGSGSDTVTVRGSDVGSIRLGGGNDTLNFSSTTVSGDLRGGAGNDTLNLPVGTVVTDNNFGTFTVEEGVSYSLSTGSFTLPSGSTVSYRSFDGGAGIPCFTQDTLIATGRGVAPVQSLRTADPVRTLGHGSQPIRWIGKRCLDRAELRANPRFWPVRILAGALGQGLPRRDLLVSRQHRMLVQSRIAQRMFGAAEVLIPAIRLIDLPGIYVDETVECVVYFHLLFDRHQVIFAEDAPTESLFTGPEALKSLSAAARQEIFAIFPELMDVDHRAHPARLIPRGRLQAQLVARHRKNNKPLLQTPVACARQEFDSGAKISSHPS